MAGILDSKERMIDFIITPQGRSQIGDGRMKIEYATLTDLHTFYTSSSPDNVAEDASNRIFFETHTAQCDLITPEIEPGNDMKPFRAGTFEIQGKQIAEGTFPNESFINVSTIMSGTTVTDSSGPLLRSLTSHFPALRILGTKDQFSDSSEFSLGYLTASFAITDRDMDINSGKGIYLKDLTPDGPDFGSVNLENTPSIYSDPRLSHFPNFKYMPPVNIANPGENPQPLGNYPKLATDDSETTSDPLEHIDKRQKITVHIDECSRDKNFMSQIFEFSKRGGIEKLDIIDYGAVQSEVGDAFRHYFFVGKLMKDAEGVDTFINIFTIEFFNEDDEFTTVHPKDLFKNVTFFKPKLPKLGFWGM